MNEEQQSLSALVVDRAVGIISKMKCLIYYLAVFCILYWNHLT